MSINKIMKERVRLVEDKNDRLVIENIDLKKEIEELKWQYNQVDKRYLEVRKENEKLASLIFNNSVDHLGDCGVYFSTKKCSCGLADLGVKR